MFVVWNLLGILDLAVAVTTAALNRSLATGSTGKVTVGPMALLPLVLIPAYLVPLFVMLHLTALFQAQRLASKANPVATTASTPPAAVNREFVMGMEEGWSQSLDRLAEIPRTPPCRSMKSTLHTKTQSSRETGSCPTKLSQ